MVAVSAAAVVVVVAVVVVAVAAAAAGAGAAAAAAGVALVAVVTLLSSWCRGGALSIGILPMVLPANAYRYKYWEEARISKKHKP